MSLIISTRVHQIHTNPKTPRTLNNKKQRRCYNDQFICLPTQACPIEYYFKMKLINLREKKRFA